MPSPRIRTSKTCMSRRQLGQEATEAGNLSLGSNSRNIALATERIKLWRPPSACLNLPWATEADFAQKHTYPPYAPGARRASSTDNRNGADRPIEQHTSRANRASTCPPAPPTKRWSAPRRAKSKSRPRRFGPARGIPYTWRRLVHRGAFLAPGAAAKGATERTDRRQTFSRWQRIAREVGQYPSTQRLDRMEPSGLTSIPAQRRNEASRGAKGGHNERPAEGSKWAQGGGRRRAVEERVKTTRAAAGKHPG
ncbi:unnamed protein product [Prorocentrum cordatum]|uniref:Uncharacterized protein n=1 Tax=Prorocentrum cordatum TaxID=2364126 RepID=A0ABN9Y0Y9_9DINO|nr:unnamed protein product [Polarella glacialis]